MATGVQIQRLCFGEAHPAPGPRHVRRELGWLCEARFLDRRERRVGGRNGGSTAYVYQLGPVGKRALEFWSGSGLAQSVPATDRSPAFVSHTLAITETYVELRRQERAGLFELIEWQSEPTCWRSYIGAYGVTSCVKPDGFAVIGDRDFERHWFIEIDQSTQRVAAIRQKMRGYQRYAVTGDEQRRGGLFPHVLWIAPDSRRVGRLEAWFRDFAPSECRFFAVTLADAESVLTGGDS